MKELAIIGVVLLVAFVWWLIGPMHPGDFDE